MRNERHSVEREANRIADLAMGTCSREAFYAEVLTDLRRVVGFDLGGFMHSSAQRLLPTVVAPGYDAERVREQMPGYLAEFDAEELRRIWVSPLTNDLDLLPPARRDRLAIYRDLFRPHGITVVTTTAWKDRFAFCGFHLARLGRGARFRAHELDLMNRLMPTIRVGGALAAATELATASPLTDRLLLWADHIGLTPRERSVAELVIRGFQNGEIARMLGVSPSTVRNHLVAIFRKGQVTTRSELAFAVASSDLRIPARKVAASLAAPYPRWDEVFAPGNSTTTSPAARLPARVRA